MKDFAHNAALFGCVVVAGFATRHALAWAWEARTERPAPKNPAAPGVSWKEALMWGAAAGVVAGVARTVVRRTYSEVTSFNSLRTP